MRTKYPERGERLRVFFNRFKIKNIAVASRLEIEPGFISQLLNGHATLTPNVAFRLGQLYPTLNINWLLTGEGEMLLTGKEGGVEESLPAYNTEGEPFEMLRQWKESFEARIKDLEARMAELERETKVGGGGENSKQN